MLLRPLAARSRAANSRQAGCWEPPRVQEEPMALADRTPRISLPVLDLTGQRGQHCRFKCANACHHEAPNVSGGEAFAHVFERAVSRRAFLGGLAGAIDADRGSWRRDGWWASRRTGAVPVARRHRAGGVDVHAHRTQHRRRHRRARRLRLGRAPALGRPDPARGARFRSRRSDTGIAGRAVRLQR